MHPKITALLQKKGVAPAAVGIVTVTTIAVGYLVWKRKRTVKMEAVSDETRDQLVLFNEDLEPVVTESPASWENNYSDTPRGESTLHVAMTDIEDAAEEEDESVPEDVAEVVIGHAAPPVVNVFTNPDTDWDWDVENAARAEEEPYVLHYEEFIQDEKNYHQETVTYYQGDDIMADSNDVPIYNYEGLMGDLKFGHGSKDPKVVYIRNDRIHHEWEVLLHTGQFAVEVRGLEVESEYESKDLKHSSNRRFRED